MKNAKLISWMETVIFTLVVAFIGYRFAGMENQGSYVHGYVCNLFIALGIISTFVVFLACYITNKKSDNTNIVKYIVFFLIISCILIFAVQTLRFNEHIDSLRNLEEFSVSTGGFRLMFSEEEIIKASTYWKPMYFDYFIKYSISTVITTVLMIILNILDVKKKSKENA